MADTAVETALEKVRELLRPDGGDIVLAEDGANTSKSANGSKSANASDPSANLADTPADGSNPAGTTEINSANSDTANPTALKLRLIVENSDCPECILPVDMLEPIALDIMSADLPSLTSVSITDPRVVDGIPAEISTETPAESTRHV